VGSTVRSSSGPAIGAGGGGYVSLYTTRVEQLSGTTSVLAEGGGTVAFWPPPANSPYVGYDRVLGGRLLARGTGRIEAGTTSTNTSQNHFCNAAAATLEVQTGGTIYARYNYWPNGAGPTSITGTGSIYYSNNLGTAQCFVNSEVFERSQGGLAGPTTAPADPDAPLSAAERALFEALDLRRAGDFAGATARLARAYTAGGPSSLTVLAELVRTYAQDPDPAIPAFLEEVAAGAGAGRAPATAALAAVRAGEGRVLEAVDLFDRAADLRDDPAEAFFDRLGAVYALVGGGEFALAGDRLARVQPGSEQDAQAAQMAGAVLAMYTGEGPARPDGVAYGAVSGTAASETELEVHGFALGEPYPNPTTNGVSVTLDLREASGVRVEVYDVMGRRIAVLAEGSLAGGRHQFQFSGGQIATGVYAVRATASLPNGETRMVVRPFTVAR
ncbi:MAG TPA: T9SS type A sorting domain-containing protein, partial [Rubricoccaceae bacterium]